MTISHTCNAEVMLELPDVICATHGLFLDELTQRLLCFGRFSIKRIRPRRGKSVFDGFVETR